MLSAISATLFAILLAMMAYADVTPVFPTSPAAEAAFGIAGLRGRLFLGSDAALGFGRVATPFGRAPFA